MHPLVSVKLPAIRALCRQFGVQRLTLFGSGATERFDPSSSDLDFLVDFDRNPVGLADRYFGLVEALEALFERPVDLVETRAITNEYFRAGVARASELLYAA
ncbi:MAG: nucleotidyltransferase domain-containing protein [Planctomycetes bacterium]|nr:nucleotidyltransferase domain-containing protein [Planctomycetota bacterium]